MLKTRTGRRYHSALSKARFSMEWLENRLMLTGPGDESGQELDPLELTQFSSDEELTRYLFDDALNRWEGLFGQPTWPYPYYWDIDGPVLLRDAAAGGVGPAPEAPNHSDTNTQVEGVDGRSFLPLLLGRKQEGRDQVFTVFDRTAGRRDYPIRCLQNHRGCLPSRRRCR